MGANSMLGACLNKYGKSSTTVLFRTVFARTIKLNLLMI